METEPRPQIAVPQPASPQSDTTRLNLTDDRTAVWSLVEDLLKKRSSGAAWFFWIAALSFINALVVVFQGQWSFLVGLGITQLISGFASGLSTDLGVGVTIVAFALNLIVLLICVGFGLFARKGHTWAFIVGMILYALDGLIFLLVSDWLSVGFHAFVLYSLYRGLDASRRLDQLKAEGVPVE